MFEALQDNSPHHALERQLLSLGEIGVCLLFTLRRHKRHAARTALAHCKETKENQDWIRSLVTF